MSENNPGAAATLLGPGTWTRQGPATLVLRENSWVVLVPGLRKQVTEAAWEVLGTKPAPEEFLDLLVEAGELESADKLTALLFGFHEGTTGTFGVRGSTPIAVYTAEGSQQIAGTEDEPFVMRTLEGVRRVAFGDLPAEDSLGAPRLAAGIVPVRGFVLVSQDPAALEEAERAALAEQVEQDGRSIEDPEVAKRRAERPAPAPARTTSTTSTPVRRPAPATRKSGEMPPSLSRGGSRAPSPAAAEAPASAGPNLFAGLFGGASAAPDAAPPQPVGAAGPAAETPAEKASPSVEAAPPAAPEQELSTAPPAAPGDAPAAADDLSASPADPSAAVERTEPAPAATQENAPTTGGPVAVPAPAAREAKTPPVARRRLVSTSLFDRRRPPQNAAASSENATSAPIESAAPSVRPSAAPSAAPSAGPEVPSASSPAAAPTPVASAPTPAAPAAAPVASAATPAAPAATPAAPVPPPTLSVPTPEPPEDDFESPPTQISPIDDGEGEDWSSAPSLTPMPRRRPAAAAPGSGDLENTGAYDDLFGKTVFRRIEDAAVRRLEDDDEDSETTGEAAAAETSSELAEETSHPGPPEPIGSEQLTEEEPQGATAAGDFIDWVPGVGRAAPEVAQAAARRASAPPMKEPAYPQVHMAERPPAPHTGSRPAPTPPPAQHLQAAPTALFGGPVNTGYAGGQVGYPGGPSQPPQAVSGPLDPGAAGLQVGFPIPQGERPSRPGSSAPDPRQQHRAQAPQQRPEHRQHSGQAGPAQQRPSGPAGGHRAPQQAPSLGSPAAQVPPAPGWNGTLNQSDPRTAAPGGSAPQRGAAQGTARHASAPHPVAPSGTPSPQLARQAQQAQQAQQARPLATRPVEPAPVDGRGRVKGAAAALPGMVCANGHANPPERSVCRACSAPLSGEARTVARPPLGAVQIAGGDRFVLDRTAIIGRRPRASRVSAQDVPQLITVPSPQQDISRSHLELRLEGWHVVAVDLGTTNGTTLYREGYEPVRLRPREGVVLHDGDHLDLGDDVHLQFGERV